MDWSIYPFASLLWGNPTPKGILSMELRSYLLLLRRWLWLILLCMLLAGGLAYLTSNRQTPVYAATATVLLDTSRPTSATPSIADITLNERLAETYAVLLSQQNTIQPVIAQLNQVPQIVSVSVSPQRNTSIMYITVESEDPVAAAYIANHLSEQLNSDQRARQGLKYAASKESYAQELDVAEADAAATRTQLVALDPEIDKAEYSSLAARLASQERLIEQLRTQIFTIRLAEDQGANIVSLLEEAQVPLLPVSPRPLYNAFYGALLGALAGLAAAFFIEYLDDTVKAAQDLPALLGTSLLALIGRMENKSKRAVVNTQDSRSPLAEAYRMLRTNIRFAMVDETIRTLLITSPSPSEGKSTTAANLAMVMAQAGHRTILIDADLRRPVQHQIFGLTNRDGLTTALIERDKSIEDYLKSTTVPDLMILTSGPMPPNPSELLGSQRMQDLLAQLHTHAEYVIIDTPPILAVTDSALLAGSVGGVLLVLRAGVTRLEAARRAIAQLTSVQARMIGTVLNGVKADGDGYYYYHQYYGQSGERRQNSWGSRMRAFLLSVLPRRG
jgi:capsular exopolysaccharide synthesis family protein